MNASPTIGADLALRLDAAPTTEQPFSLRLRLYRDYAQVVDFGPPDFTLVALDEPPPLGYGYGPSPARVLASSVGGCLGASVLYCLRKARVEVAGLTTKVEGSLVRNERGRLRVGRLRVTLAPTVPSAARDRVARCLELFDDYCIVTESDTASRSTWRLSQL